MPTKKKKDAISLLIAEHEEVRKLLGDLAETTTRAKKKRTELLEEIGVMLRVHAKIEEEIFYPAFLDAAEKSEDRKMFHEAREEHRAVEELVLPDLEKTDPGTEEFGGRAKVLKELVEHHADEEEDSMFPRAKKLFAGEQLRELGEQMEERKLSLLESMEQGV